MFYISFLPLIHIAITPNKYKSIEIALKYTKMTVQKDVKNVSNI